MTKYQQIEYNLLSKLTSLDIFAVLTLVIIYEIPTKYFKFAILPQWQLIEYLLCLLLHYMDKIKTQIKVIDREIEEN